MAYLRQRLRILLAGDELKLAQWTLEAERRWALICAIVLVLGCAVYGATFGLWRSGGQGFFTALKFPLVVVVTCAGNALLNGCLAIVLGTGMGFRQSSLAILMSFAIMAIILAAFSPIMLFLYWNVPGPYKPMGATGQEITLLAHVTVIAFAGVMGNRRLWQLLRRLTGSAEKAHGVLFSWLASNLLMGSQISWIVRPWIGSAGRPVSFFSEEPFRGSFFEAVWNAAQHLFSSSIHL